MKILFLSRTYYPHIGGVEKHVEEVSRKLIKKGHQITVLTLKHDSKLAEIETQQGIKIIRIPYSNSKWGIWKNIWHKRSLFKQSDIIHAHDVFFWYLPLQFLYLTKPVFTTFHGWEGKFPVPLKNKLARKIWEKLSRGNICVGDYLKKWYGTKPDMITYGGIQINTLDRGYKMATKNLNQCVFIGRLEADLGITEYLKALSAIKKKYGFKIIFVGDGSFKNQAEKIGQVIGFVNDISTYLKKPSFIFTSSYLTILESMAAKRPVFSLYQNQLKKDYLTMFPGSKFMRISGSANQLISQFKNAMTNSSSRDKLVVKAHNFATKQTWSQVAGFYLKLWKHES